MSGPLQDITVVDLSRALAGPHAAMMLGDMGARVIKVETPGTGDDTRGWGPPFVGPEDDPISTYFLSANRNKESITLDLKSDDGRDVLTRLVQRSDVLIENFRPGVLDRLGFTVERLHELNPRLVVLAISGFGHDGPQGGRAGYDQIAQGEAGLMSVTGPSADEPTRIGVPIGDLLAGMYGAYGVVAALHERNTTGKGRVVRTSLLAAVVGAHAFQGTAYTVAGHVGHAQGNHHPALSPYGLFHCEDGDIQIACGSESLWVKLAEAFDIDPTRTGAGDEPRPGHPPRPRPLDPQRDLRDLAPRRPPPPPRRTRHPLGRGPHHRPRLRLGPDPFAGPRAQRRPPRPRRHRDPRTADPL